MGAQVYENDNLKRCQKSILRIMDEIHNVCTKHNITYYMLGGSVLGAVRHHGFIPWDMDADIGMLRKDYERFASVCQTELSPALRYVSFKNGAEYFMPHAAVALNTAVVYLSPDYYRRVKKENVLVDIFPLDNAPNSEEERQRQKKELQRLSKIQSREECVLYKRNTFPEIIAKKCLQFGLKLFYPIAKVNNDQDRVMRRYENETTTCICSMASQYAYEKQCMDKSIYGNPILMDFEGRQYFVPEQTDVYLTRIYGSDYMCPPPIEKRYRLSEYIAAFKLIEEKHDEF